VFILADAQWMLVPESQKVNVEAQFRRLPAMRGE